MMIKIALCDDDTKVTEYLHKKIKEILFDYNLKYQINIYNDGSELLSKLRDGMNFDILFLDPPFKDKKFTEILKVIKEKHICNKKHVVIIHREKKVEDYLKDSIDIVLAKNYGRSKIIFGTFN